MQVLFVMMYLLKTLCSLLVLTFLLPSGCAGTTTQGGLQHRDTQLAALKSFSQWEADITRFCRSQPGISEADVYVRENQALILLTSDSGSSITPETIETIHRFVKDTTGFTGDHIIMKHKNLRGTH